MGNSKVIHVLLPRIPIIPTDWSIQFKHTQFSTRLVFTITIKKAEGQTKSIVYIRLKLGLFFT